jgi:flagellar biosynthetic protein FlhB
MVALLGPSLTKWFIVQMKHGLSCEHVIFASTESFLAFINGKTADLMLVTLPILAVLFVGAVLAGVAISGFNFAPGAIKLRFNLVNPIAGLQKLVNARSAVHLLTSIVKLFFVTIIVWLYLRDRIDMLAPLRWAWSLQILAAIAKIILGLMIRVCIALLIIGIADTFYQKWKYIKDLKMTRQEVKEERKQTEGSPEVKRRLRQKQFEMSLKRMMQEVPKANVVLVNPTHVAVALRYEAKTMEAPIMVAKGADHLAEKIKEIAQAYGVPIVRKPELARTIYSTVKLGGPIPETLYIAVAEVLALIYRLRHKK